MTNISAKHNDYYKVKFMTIQQHSLIQGLLRAVLAYILFATHDVIVKILSTEFSVPQIIFFATLSACPFLLIGLSLDPIKESFRPKNPRMVIMRTINIVIIILCTFYAFANLPLVDTYSILLAQPLFVTFLSVFMLGEQIRIRRILSSLLGIIGVLIILRPGYNGLTIYHFLPLIVAVIGAFNAIITRQAQQERELVMISYPIVGVLIFTMILMPNSFIPFTIKDLWLMIILGGLSVMANFLLISAYKITYANIISPMQYTQIIWSTIYGYLVFNQISDMWVMVGSSLVVMSGLIIFWRESQEQASLNRPNLFNIETRSGISRNIKITTQTFADKTVLSQNENDLHTNNQSIADQDKVFQIKNNHKKSNLSKNNKSSPRRVLTVKKVKNNKNGHGKKS